MLRKTELEGGAILNEELIDAKIVSIPEEVKTLKTDKATEYRNVICSYKLPNGTSRKAVAKLWEKALISNAEAFVVDADVTLAVQVEGQYRGHSKVELPSMLVDLDSMFGPATVVVAETTKAPVEAEV